MHIAIKDFATFHSGRFKMARRNYPAETVVRQVLDDLGVAPEALGSVLLNGCRSHLEQYLYDGDTLSLLPAARNVQWNRGVPFADKEDYHP